MVEGYLWVIHECQNLKSMVITLFFYNHASHCRIWNVVPSVVCSQIFMVDCNGLWWSDTSSDWGQKYRKHFQVLVHSVKPLVSASINSAYNSKLCFMNSCFCCQIRVVFKFLGSCIRWQMGPVLGRLFFSKFKETALTSVSNVTAILDNSWVDHCS